MLAGDFATFPISDLLQWFDQSRRPGIVEIEGTPRGGFWMEIADRCIVAASPPVDAALGTSPLSPWTPQVDPRALWAETSRDRVLDLFFDQEHRAAEGRQPGRFTFADGARGPEGGVSVDLPVQELVLDGLRRLDEWEHLAGAFPDDAAVLVCLDDQPEPSACGEALLQAGQAELSLTEARVVLGLSRQALLYRLEPLCMEGRLRVERREARTDPLVGWRRQIEALIQAGQLEAAARVLRSLWIGGALLPRMAELGREVERGLVTALQAELPSQAVPRPRAAGAVTTHQLTLSERGLLAQIDGQRDVATLVLGQPRQALESLQALRRLVQLGAVEL